MNGALTIASGVLLVAGGAAGMAFGVIDPVTGSALVANGLGMLGVNSKLGQIAQGLGKDKEIKIHVEK